MRKKNQNLCFDQAYYSKEIKHETIERIHIEFHLKEKEIL
jgi:hypothetical protein